MDPTSNHTNEPLAIPTSYETIHRHIPTTLQRSSSTVRKSMFKLKQLFMAVPLSSSKDPQDFSDIVFMDSPEIFREQDLIPLHEEVITTKIYIEDNLNPESVSFRIATFGNTPMLTCEKAIELICQRVDWLQTPPYTLYYRPEKQSRFRIEVPSQEFIDHLLPLYDEWCLFSSTKTFQINVFLGNTNESYLLEYQKELSVKDAIQIISNAFKLLNPEKYNLFVNTNDAYWLDVNHELAQYGFEKDQRIELHNAAEQVFIRVDVPELETRFVVKTLSIVKTRDLISIILYSLASKNLSLNYEIANYSCWLPKAEIWISEDDPLHLHLDNLTIKDVGGCGVEFKQRFAKLKVYSSISKTKSTIYTRVENKVQELVHLFCLEDPHLFHYSTVLASNGGDELKENETVGEALRHIPSPFDFQLKMESKTIQLTTSMDKKLGAISITLDISLTLAALKPVISRRLGIKQSILREFYFGHAPLETLPEDVPIYQFRLDIPGLLLVVGMKSEDFKKETVEMTKLWNSISTNSEHTSIWCEGPEHPNNIVYDEKHEIIAASLNKLIEKITPEVTKDFNDYTSLLQTFFWTYPSFTTTAIVFTKLRERYFIPRFCHQSISDFDKLRMSIQSRICNLLKTWTKDYPTSFLGPSGEVLANELLLFTQHIMAADRQHVVGKQIRKNLFKLLRQYKSEFQPKLPLTSLDLSNSFVNPQGLFQNPTAKVAKEFCNSIFLVYAAIRPTELLNQKWMKPGATETAPNITLLSQRFNNLARWITKSILIVKDIQQRATRMEWIIEVAGFLLEHKNFFVLMSFLAGLGNSAVSRLKYTKARMSARYRKKLEELEEVMDPKNSYKAYRASLREPKQDGTVSRIPYLAVHLSDLVYVEDGNPDNVQGLINFAKRKLVYTVINDILQHQGSPYNFEAYTTVLQRWVANCFSYHADQKEEELYKISLLLEPRGWDGVSPFTEKVEKT